MSAGIYQRTKEHNQNISKALKGKPQNWLHKGMLGKIPWNKKSIKKECKICKSIFYIPPSRNKRNNVKYCSKKCMGIDFKITDKYKGKNHPQWKGGIRKNSRGYIRIYQPEHPFVNKDKSVLEHRLVMEKYLGRYLKPKEVVHHLNGITNDNRLDNLTICSPFNHYIFIKNLQKRIKELENQLFTNSLNQPS